MPGYNPAAIEKKWQRRWAEGKTFATDVRDHKKPKYYVLDMFPYPSGKGLHVGHPEGYTATDILARYKRAKGFNVMHPMGWDAFGLPAEQTAIKEGVHPRETTERNIETFRRQLQALGFSYDWDREVDTTEEGYYRWTQWIFLKLYETWFDEEEQRGRPISELVEEFKNKKRTWGIDLLRVGAQTVEDILHPHKVEWDDLTPAQQRKILAGYRLAYESEAAVNWCAGLGTVLSNEEVIDGKSEVGGFPVERKPMRQWMLRITKYSERLIEGLAGLDWSESLKEMQRNWIGRSEGAEVSFKLETIDCDKSMNHLSMDLDPISVFTTRPDTLFGATYMVIAPEHELAMMAGKLTHQWPAKTPQSWIFEKPTPGEAVQEYQRYARSRSERERQEDAKKTGVFTGFYAINPVNDARIPIFVSDYVLMGYGTGAIMAVPAHDERDHEFAVKFGLGIVQVVGRGTETRRHEGTKDHEEIDVLKEAFVEEGIAVNSGELDGLGTEAAKSRMISILEEKGIGKRRVQYKLRDWLFSRQRYWGEPFPIVHLEDGTTVGLAESELPLRLPELADFRPTGTIEPPLSKAKGWVEVWVVLDGDGRARVVAEGTVGAVKGRRELNTMPQWAGSCWYYIRYLDPRNTERFVDPAVEKYWLGSGGGGVDMYVGGVEHAVLHLLYSRFWHKVLFDWKLVSCEEPFRKLVNQGLILGEAEYTAFRTESAGQRASLELVDWSDTERPIVRSDVNLVAGLLPGQTLIAEKVEPEHAEKRGEHFILKADAAIRIDARSFKMSKSRGNVVNPDDVIQEYGADSLRMFEMFMGPLEQVKPWSTAGVEGVYRFLQRVWRNLFDENDGVKTLSTERGTLNGDLVRALHRLIKKAGEDIEKLSFNTSIAAMMEFNNLVGKMGGIDGASAVTFMRVLEPFAPHFAEEVYERLGGKGSISALAWPAFDAAMLVDATIEIPVQINGKLRSRITVANDVDEAGALAAALADPEVQKQIAGKELKKKIYVKGRMVNLVI